MTSTSWPGAGPRRGRGTFAAGLIALGCVTPGTGTLAAPERSIEFQGELSYDAFKRASAKGVGIRIKQSPGGTGAAAMVLGRARGLVIDGPCNSACAWGFVQNEKACFTARASFGFHAAHDPGTGRRLPAATDYWLGTVGPALRARLQGLRTSSRIIRVGAKEMGSYYAGRMCGARTSQAETAPARPSAELPLQLSNAKAVIWSEVDVQAGAEALRVARDSDSVTFAATALGNVSSAAAETRGAGTRASPFSTLMPVRDARDPQPGVWPIAAQIHWDGVVAWGARGAT